MDLSTLFAVIALAILLVNLVVHYTGIFLIRYAKKYRWAAIFYTCLIKLAPVFSSNYINRSWAYLNLKEYKRAIQDCDRAIALKPGTPMAYNNRGFAYLALNQYQEALQNLNRAIELKPDFALAYQNRCRLHVHMKEYQRAIQDADLALAWKSQNAWTYYLRGFAYLRLKEYQRALQDYEQVLRFNPTYCDAYHNRGYAYLCLNDFEQGRTNFLKAWELHPISLHGWMVESCQLCVEKPDLATAERLEKLASPEGKPETHYVACLCRGVALWLREQYEEALIELEQALMLKLDSEAAYFWVGMTCASLGRDEEARQALDHALKLGLPPVLLAPLKLLQEQRPAFFALYANAIGS